MALVSGQTEPIQISQPSVAKLSKEASSNSFVAVMLGYELGFRQTHVFLTVQLIGPRKGVPYIFVQISHEMFALVHHLRKKLCRNTTSCPGRLDVH